MEKLIIQHNNRHGRLSEYVKSSGTCMSLGRGLDNDIILSDHFIAAEQIRFIYEDEQWKLKLLDSTNPVLINNKLISTDVAIESGDELTVGRTHLILLLSNHPLERTRKLMLSNWMYHKGLRLTLPLLALMISTLLSVFTEYQEITSKIRWGHLAASGLGYISLILFWSGAWSLVSRLSRHKSSYLEQLFYTALMMSVLNVGMLFTGYIEFATTNNAVGFIIEWGFLLFILSVLLKYNLAYATELRKCTQVSFAIIATSMLFIFAIQHMTESDFDTNPDYSTSLKPPFSKWSSDKSVEVYMSNIEKQFDSEKK